MTDPIELAARRIVERVVLQTGGCFDYAKHAGEFYLLLYDLIHSYEVTDPFAVTVAQRRALTRLRDALSFEALASDYRNLMGDLIPVETMIPNLRRHFGHAAHRARSICTEQLRRLR